MSIEGVGVVYFFLILLLTPEHLSIICTTMLFFDPKWPFSSNKNSLMCFTMCFHFIISFHFILTFPSRLFITLFSSVVIVVFDHDELWIQNQILLIVVNVTLLMLKMKAILAYQRSIPVAAAAVAATTTKTHYFYHFYTLEHIKIII